MKIERPEKKKVRFDSLELGDTFISLDGIFFVKKETIQTYDGDEVNALCLENWSDCFFYGIDMVFPIETVLKIVRE